MNVTDLLVRSAADHPDRPALRAGDRVLTYRELDEASARMADLVQVYGVTPGARVGVMLPNVPEFAVAYYGVLRAGGVVVPLNPLLKAREVAFHLTDAGAGLLVAAEAAAPEAKAGAEEALDAPVIVVDDDFLPELAEREPATDVVDRDPQDTAVLLYTSGTTGKPKGAELTHDNLVRNVEVSQSDLLQLTPDDVVFGGLPLFHAFGQTVTLNTTIAQGAVLVLLARFAPAAALALMADQRVTVFAGVPTMYGALLGEDGAPELPDLRVCVSGGAALPVEVLHRFEERFGAPVLEGYGLSETSPVASFNRVDARRPGTIGHPVSGVEMRIVDAESGEPVEAGEAGEIAVRGHNVMKGYWQRPDATAEVLSDDGWFRTGDIGRVDEDGFFAVVDRKKEVVIRGGFNVYPRELEEVLYEHPDVAEAAVIGLPDDRLGEEVGSAVALRPGATITETELRDHVKAQVAAYKYPRHVWFVDALPKGPTGKIQKREIVPPAAVTGTEQTR